MKKKSWGTILLSAAMVVGLAACGGTSDSPASGGQNSESASNGSGTEQLKIGAVLELTGKASVWGVPQRDAIQMAVEKINADGGINGKKLDLIVYDNESNETNSLVAAKKLVSQDEVLAVIGAGTTPTTMPLIPYMTKEEVPLVSVGSGDEIVHPVEERKWIFKTPSNNADISTSIVQFLKAQGKTKVAFISVNNAYGDSGKQTFEQIAKESGIEIIGAEKFGATDKDMKPQLTRIKSLNPDAVIVWAIPPAASIVNRNFWELKMDSMLIYSSGAGANAFIELAGEAAEGTYIATSKVWVADQLPADDPQKEILVDYVKAYEEKYKAKPSPIDGMAYDAVLVLTEAIKQAAVKGEVTRATIRDGLENVNHLVGLTGIFDTAADNHQGLKPEDVVMLQVRDGKWVLAQ
ncbi:ABC transporter substrate-binding protein [Brevibacillus humidisoli]|uniref:ABC transporter substrate-binding protein n=1 Tax=Brevibacillus humidisoli TaxID=2895522 RepID=UPI001E298803|nr:ABC transporter substrate-binding protein [Brevibacillus humidisoli]UFJ39436.1 ABC transporter substrate-binding protein [Brevibacillus humidisoli]